MITLTASATLVLVDLQNEFVTPGRPFFMEELGPSLENAALLLDHARASKWRVLHVRHEQSGPLFTMGSALADFIDGFEPLPGEPVFVKSEISPFTNPAFKAAIAAAGAEPVYVAGCGSPVCCLATMVAAPLFGHRFTFVHDASWAWSPRIDVLENEAHWHATALIALHGDVVSTDQVIGPIIGMAA